VPTNPTKPLQMLNFHKNTKNNSIKCDTIRKYCVSLTYQKSNKAYDLEAGGNSIIRQKLL
jgi:hypothetical protein